MMIQGLAYNFACQVIPPWVTYVHLIELYNKGIAYVADVNFSTKSNYIPTII